MLDFIEDGYTEDGYLEAIEGLRNAVRFKYRPAGHLRREAVMDSLKNKPAKDYCRIIHQLLLDTVLEWDIADGNGGTLPLNMAWITKLRPVIIEGMYGIVLGLRASDPDPQNPGNDAEELASSAEDGASVGAHREEASAKN